MKSNVTRTKEQLAEIARGVAEYCREIGQNVPPREFYFRGDRAAYLGTTSAAFGTVWFDAIYREGHRKNWRFVVSSPPAGTTLEALSAVYAAHGLAKIQVDVLAGFVAPVFA